MDPERPNVPSNGSTGPQSRPEPPGAPGAVGAFGASGRPPHPARHLLVLLPLLFLLMTGRRGLDFGRHWDEPVQIETLHTAIDSQTLLPKWYRYPSMMFWMAMGALGPEIVEDLPEDGNEMRALQERLRSTVDGEPYLLRMRGVFLAVASLTLVWTYLLASSRRGSALEGLVAASALGLSWEVAYHARWIAPDAVLMQFSALTLLLATLGIRRRSVPWIAAAAGAAGLGCGTKYTGGILLLPVLVALWQVSADAGWVRRLRRASGCGLVFVLAFVLSTPGAVLQPFVFFRHLGFEIEHYRTGHYGATIEAGLPHLLSNLRYLGAHLFSHLSPLALAITALVLVGLVQGLRRERPRTLLLALFPLIYLAYMSTQRVMFVRNLLLLAPALAVFAARGVVAIPRALPKLPEHLPATLLLAALWGFNGTFVYHASTTILERDPDADLAAFHAWAGEHPDLTLFVSGRVTRNLERLGLALPPNATRERSGPVEAAAFYPGETESNAQLRANRPGTALAVFGPLDVNFDFYPAWQQPKIVVYPRAAALDAGILREE